MADALWQLPSKHDLPSDFMAAVGRYCSGSSGGFAAQLLWQRGIRDRAQLAAFIDPDCYQPTSAFAWGDDMIAAVQRLKAAYQAQERVAIWGDFDADGVTATAVLWDGLGQFFPRGDRLSYVIPNRLTESHGLSIQGLNALAEQGVQLVVTCDTGCNNLVEIAHAQSLGIDLIITDHHTLPEQPAPGAITINPRRFPPDHSLASLSGVAVAYKLVEALYETLPQVPQAPLEHLLDLVAVGLIADLVELKGDCRYLAQTGIRQLQRQTQMARPTRPGIAELLNLCRKTGDRPTDISFGLGPRINAVSRIHGDAGFCVDLLTSTDLDRCRQLAEATELANSRRKALQRDVVNQVTKKLDDVDLSTTHVIVLADSQWPIGVLGLVAGQIAQDYARPTILLTLQPDGDASESTGDLSGWVARGSARSLHAIDLYELMQSQAHLLKRFGGHPFAAGLSLAGDHVPIFADAINQEFRLRYGSAVLNQPVVAADLTVSVAELGQSLFRELKLLEPYGMGNPTPRLLIRNCWFEDVWHRKVTDAHNRKINYIRTTFEIWDETVSSGFPGMWWGHYKDEIPTGICDAIVELDYVSVWGRPSAYQVRLVDVRSHQTATLKLPDDSAPLSPNPDQTIGDQISDGWLVDWRGAVERPSLASVLVVETPPGSWQDFFDTVIEAQQQGRAVAIDYPPPPDLSPVQTWQQLVGIAKHLSRTQKSIELSQLSHLLHIGDRTLQLGLKALAAIGFYGITDGDAWWLTRSPQTPSSTAIAQATAAVLTPFLAAVGEERFRQRYFYEIPVATLQAIAQQYLRHLHLQPSVTKN